MSKIIDFIDKHSAKLVLLIVVCIFIVAICLVIINDIYNLKINVVDVELNKRMVFCHDKFGYVEYFYDCDLVSECKLLYVDCDYVNTWQMGKEYDGKGTFDMTILRESYDNYSKNIKNKLGNNIVPIWED